MGVELGLKKISIRNIWQDTFFYGVWHRDFKDGEVLDIDLRKLEGYNFRPVISEDEFLLLQEHLIKTNRKSIEQRKSRLTKRLDAVTPLENGIVIDDDSEKPLSFSLPNAQRFRVRLVELQESKPDVSLSNIVTPHQIKYSIPGNNINFDVLDEYLANQFKKIKISKEDYQAFLFALRGEIGHKYEERILKQKQIDLLLNKHYRKEADFMKKANFGENLTGKERQTYEKEKEKFKSREIELTNEKLNVSQDTRDEVLEQQAFYELLMNLPKLWEKASYVQKRKLSELLLLNIKVKDGKPISMKVKPEFEHMFPEKFRSGGGSKPYIEPTARRCDPILDQVLTELKAHLSSISVSKVTDFHKDISVFS